MCCVIVFQKKWQRKTSEQRWRLWQNETERCNVHVLSTHQVSSIEFHNDWTGTRKICKDYVSSVFRSHFWDPACRVGCFWTQTWILYRKNLLFSMTLWSGIRPICKTSVLLRDKFLMYLGRAGKQSTEQLRNLRMSKKKMRHPQVHLCGVALVLHVPTCPNKCVV